jgi:uncharacterized membrane protein
MSTFYLLLIPELLGLGIALYLVWSRKRNEKPVCVIGGKCNVVLESKYNKLFGLHNDVGGALYYLATLAFTVLLRYDIGPPDLLLAGLKTAAIVGAMMAAVLMVIQWKVLKAWCFWCVTSNINTGILALIILTVI